MIMLLYLLENQADVMCDFEENNCDTVLSHHDMMRTAVKNIDRTSKSSYPKADHTFGQGI